MPHFLSLSLLLSRLAISLALSLSLSLPHMLILSLYSLSLSTLLVDSLSPCKEEHTAAFLITAARKNVYDRASWETTTTMAFNCHTFSNGEKKEQKQP